MPYTRRTKRPARRPRRTVKRRRVRKARGLARGGFTIKRRGQVQILTASAANTAQVKTQAGATGGCLTLGTPAISYSTGMSGVYDIPFSMTFSLEELISYSDLTSIADKFMIKSVKMEVHGYNVSQVTGGVVYNPLSWIEYVEDHDDNTVPSISQLDEKMGVRTKGFNQRGMLTFTARPKVTVLSKDGYTIANPRSLWIDMATPQQPHYGVKGVLRGINLYDVKACAFKFQPTYTVAVRDLQ